MQHKTLFYVFGALQAATLGLIVFFTLGQGDTGKDRVLLR